MTSKGSDQTAYMCRLIRGFAGRTYHIVGNLMLRLNYRFHVEDNSHIFSIGCQGRSKCSFDIRQSERRYSTGKDTPVRRAGNQSKAGQTNHGGGASCCQGKN